MLQATQTAIEKIQLYIGESWHYALFLLALLYLIFLKEEEKSRHLFLGYTLVYAIVYLCPLTARIIMDYCIGQNVYWRMLWLLPMPIIIAYSATKFCRRWKHPLAQILSVLLILSCIVMTGTCLYTPGTTPYVKAENINKLPTQVIDICDQIQADSGEERPGVVAPYELVGYMRQYDAGIDLAYGRRISGLKRKRLFEEMLAQPPDFAVIAKLSKAVNCQYLIYNSNDETHQAILSQGYTQIGQNVPYRIYKRQSY